MKNSKKELDLFKIDSYSKVCKELKELEEFCPYKRIKQIEKLFCRNWKKDWKDQNQRKWYPYYILSTSGGLVFYGSSYHCYRFDGGVAFYPTEEISNFVGKTFIKEYERLM